MSEAGYTLVETLLALAVLALAVQGVATGLQLMARQQFAVSHVLSDTADRRAAQTALSRELETLGPFRAHEPQKFSGDAGKFSFDCGQATPCEALLVSQPEGLELELRRGGEPRVLPLRGARAAKFVYHGALGPSLVWPPTTPKRQTLRAVAVTPDGVGQTADLLIARVWREQPLVCEFDPVMQDCR